MLLQYIILQIIKISKQSFVKYKSNVESLHHKTMKNLFSGKIINLSW